MSVKMRQYVERQIVTRLVKDALRAGYSLGVDNGDGAYMPMSKEQTLTAARKSSVKAVLAAMFTTDEDYLYVYHYDEYEPFGWVRLIYGNDGPDVISDYSTNLEHIMAGANAEADKWSD